MHPERVPLARATLHYLATLTGQGYSPETVRLYRENLAQFADFLGGEPTLDELTLESALRYQQHLQQRPQKATALRRSTGGLSPYTIHQHGRALRSFTTWLWRHGYLEGNRLADFHPGRLPEREVEPLSPAEQQQVLAAMDGHTYAERAGLTVRVTSLERTLVDVVHRPDLAGGWEEVWRSVGSIEFLDLDRIVAHALEPDNATTIAKLGFVISQHRDTWTITDRQLQPLRDRRPRRPHYLDRSRREPGHLLKDWNLVVPFDVLDDVWEEVL